MAQQGTHKRAKPRPQRRGWAQPWGALVVAGAVLLGGLGLWLVSQSSAPAEPAPQAILRVEPQDKADIARSFPPWLVSAPARAQQSYTQAVKHRDELSYIPCYCGCEKIGHVSVADCHVDEIATDGRITYDRHAAG